MKRRLRGWVVYSMFVILMIAFIMVANANVERIERQNGVNTYINENK